MLIAFEGIQGSGKSTIIKKIADELTVTGKACFVSEWNSDLIYKPFIQKVKSEKYFTPVTYCLLHACEFLARYEREILPALDRQEVVLCDRYYFTPLTRDWARGISEEYIMNIYQNVISPDLVVYVNTSLDIACERKKKYVEAKNLYDTFYYNAGIDVTNLAFEKSLYKYKALLQNRYGEIFSKMNNVLEINESKNSQEAIQEILNYII